MVTDADDDARDRAWLEDRIANSPMSLGTALDIADKMRWGNRSPVFDCRPEEHYEAFKRLAAEVRKHDAR